MKNTRDKHKDLTYIELSTRPVARTKTHNDGRIVLDVAEDGTQVGIERVSPSLDVVLKDAPQARVPPPLILA
ncbi:MAG: DUF2283 domain-containing protein [Blastochloris sp.]|nr:DUF2283 domain-containing protein [Blastochloris sp.]